MSGELRADGSNALAASQVQIVLGVPGPWETRTELVRALTSAGYVLGTDWLRHADTGELTQIDIYPHDDTLARAFALAGGSALAEADLKQIAAHRCTLYLIASGGTPELARRMLRVASDALAAGGIAVKVESSGIAHSAREWQRLAGETAPEALYQAYVTLVRSELQYYSCGMHLFGYRDAEAPAELEAEVATRLLETFVLYTLRPNAELREGDIFSTGPEATRFRLRQVECTEYPPDDLFFNPFGMWRLIPPG